MAGGGTVGVVALKGQIRDCGGYTRCMVAGDCDTPTCAMTPLFMLARFSCCTRWPHSFAAILQSPASPRTQSVLIITCFTSHPVSETGKMRHLLVSAYLQGPSYLYHIIAVRLDHGQLKQL